MAGRYPHTPDGHYFVVKGRLWRCTNPSLSESEQKELRKSLMAARRAVRGARGDPQALARARRGVQEAKEALGERGPPWWSEDEGGTHDGKKVENTPYAAWFVELEGLETTS